MRRFTALSEGLGANSFCFAGLLAVVAAYRHSLISAMASAAAVLILVICSVLLTARAPIAAMFLSCIVAALLSRGRFWGWLRGQWSRSLAVAAVVIVVPVIGFFAAIHKIAFSDHARALAGRAALWQIAVTEAPHHMLVGTGPRTFTDVIRSSIGEGVFSSYFEKQAIYALTGGGFHNIWVNTLVERGLIGFAGLLVSFVILTAMLLRGVSEARPMRRFTALSVLLFILSRNFVEITGIMSYADSATDLLVILAFALVVAPPAPKLPPARPKPRRRQVPAAGSPTAAVTPAAG